MARLPVAKLLPSAEFGQLARNWAPGGPPPDEYPLAAGVYRLQARETEELGEAARSAGAALLAPLQRPEQGLPEVLLGLTRRSCLRLAEALTDHPRLGSLAGQLRRMVPPRAGMAWELAHGRKLELEAAGPPALMGIINLTPDSFYDGGTLAGRQAALERAERMLEEGAQLLDLGGESSRPGAGPVPLAEELERVLPLVRELVRRFPQALLSVDSYKAEVARAAIGEGAHAVNDISAGQLDPRMAETVAALGAGWVMMHMRGEPRTMQQQTEYTDLIGEVFLYFADCRDRARAEGVPPERIVLDPGIGFGKPRAGNYRLIARLEEFRSLGQPLLVGPSRKSFLSEQGEPPSTRLEATLAACAVATINGAQLLRVHDVGPVSRAVRAASHFREEF